jgi:hypothetical protein
MINGENLWMPRRSPSLSDECLCLTAAWATAGYQYHLIGGKSPLVDRAAKDLSCDVADPGAQGIHTNNDFIGETVHLGETRCLLWSSL